MHTPETLVQLTSELENAFPTIESGAFLTAVAMLGGQRWAIAELRGALTTFAETALTQKEDFLEVVHTFLGVRNQICETDAEVVLAPDGLWFKGTHVPTRSIEASTHIDVKDLTKPFVAGKPTCTVTIRGYDEDFRVLGFPEGMRVELHPGVAIQGSVSKVTRMSTHGIVSGATYTVSIWPDGSEIEAEINLVLELDLLC